MDKSMCPRIHQGKELANIQVCEVLCPTDRGSVGYYIISNITFLYFP